jgi:hypothetical protein
MNVRIIQAQLNSQTQYTGDSGGKVIVLESNIIGSC